MSKKKKHCILANVEIYSGLLEKQNILWLTIVTFSSKRLLTWKHLQCSEDSSKIRHCKVCEEIVIAVECCRYSYA